MTNEEGTGNQEASQQSNALMNSAISSLYHTVVEIIRKADEEGYKLTNIATGISHAAVYIAAWVASGMLTKSQPTSPDADGILEKPPTLQEERTAMSERLTRRMSAALREGIEEEAKALGIPGPITRTLWSGGSGPVWPGKPGTA